ncbi:penicillin-binding transpeptidase domain-containing protein [Atopomonas sediminilitoris]|uniref:penicillin-binding transpeptidase domain-containing protein n=1 Tax=Atopomonas sediminilitoris TaxID=2919919 RepID=UPI001F4DCC0A|nr:penicillin-binding transpeptidase domain-containing protein [Atopomonas sediminilitoris]MCJ8170235.1 class D beta-lactamase [Atopomonas sediminilitoris]
MLSKKTWRASAVSLFLALLPITVQADSRALTQAFSAANARGTLVIESLNGDTRWVHELERAAVRYPAASTFKVLHSLIALHERVFSGPDSRIAWDGTEHEMSVWNRDQTLDSAFRVSCVWCYQRLARALGPAVYPGYIQTTGYGQLRQPFVVDQFWLDGSLRISALEQVAFLRTVVQRQPPFSPADYASLARLMLLEQGAGWQLYGKTGWFTRAQPGVGWFVGYLQRDNGTWLFALNLDTQSAADLPLRQSIVMSALRAQGLLPSVEQ